MLIEISDSEGRVRRSSVDMFVVMGCGGQGIRADVVRPTTNCANSATCFDDFSMDRWDEQRRNKESERGHEERDRGLCAGVWLIVGGFFSDSRLLSNLVSGGLFQLQGWGWGSLNAPRP